VSIVVPAHNESVVIARAVSSLAASHYPDFEIIVVDDGSTDGTPEAIEALDLQKVRLLRQQNQGKAAALNRGTIEARNQIVVMVDADTVFERATLKRLVQPLADPKVGAVSGNTKVGNRGGFLGRFQHIEYVMGFNLDRRLYDRLGSIPTIPGAIGAFRRNALLQIGGVSSATLAEDTDLTLAIHRGNWRVSYAEYARAWTEAPSSLGALWRQRFRWSYGTMQAVWKHKDCLWRPNAKGQLRRRALLYLTLFQIILPLSGPMIDLLALYGLIFTNPIPVIFYYALFNALLMVQAVYAFILDRESLRPLWALPIQQFLYRQLIYLVVIEAIRSALLGLRLRWQQARRTGRIEDAPASTHGTYSHRS
jgi:cellulose synthase/poly-beta-1,6-N-acetylglucosamine synthase-like glycosyltransferase